MDTTYTGLSIRDYRIANQFIRKQSLFLMENENKSSTRSGFPINLFLDLNPHQQNPKYCIALST